MIVTKAGKWRLVKLLCLLNTELQLRVHLVLILLKVLLQLIVILFVSAIVGQQLLMPHLQDSLFRQQKQWVLRYLADGSIDLLMEKLEAMGSEQRKVAFSQVKTEFGFTVEMLSVQSLDLPEADAEQLLLSGVWADEQRSAVYRLSSDGSFVVAFIELETAASHIVSHGQWWTMGTFAMLEQFIARELDPELVKLNQQLAEMYRYPAQVKAMSDVELSTSQLSALRSGEIVTEISSDSLDYEFPFDMAYKKVPDQERVMVLGPMLPGYIEKLSPVLVQYYLMMSLLLLLPLILWIIPTWRSIKGLSWAARAFGKGELGVRVKHYSGSNIASYVKTFNGMADQIQKLINVNKSLINAVSHELRNPLARIEFDLELARGSRDPQAQEKIHDRIETSVEELRHLIDEMLGYARFEQQQPALQWSQVNLKEWLHAGVEQWRSPQYGGNISVLCQGQQVFASLDRYYMDRVLSNLVGNACKYASEQITIGFTCESGEVKVWVEDDGQGIKPQERDKIFEAFIRLDKSRNKQTGGIGLGLAIVKQIMDWHKGMVTVDDSSLGGAKFMVSWPGKKSG